MRTIRNIIGGLGVLAAVLIAGKALAGGSHQLTPVSVATLAGASSCDESGYTVRNRLDGSTQTIYDCLVRQRARCVTVSDGIASDSTLEVRLLFRNTLGATRPACAH